jgi:sulfite reductase (ferredoxin)
MNEAASPVERVKQGSRHLRGLIAEELAETTSHFSDPQTQLLKFHGIYQQEQRDLRQARKAAGLEKAYQFMVRSRIPGGALTAEQYLVHDRLATRFANGTLRITTRQGFQLHGVLKGNLRPALREINDALLTTLAACGDVNRNVMACPAPATDHAHAVIQSIAHEIADRLTPRTGAYHEIWLNGERVRTVAAHDETEPLYGSTYLPRKFKIGVAHAGDNCVDVFTQDIGLVAHERDGAVEGYTVLVGGGMGSTHGKSETYPRLGTPLCFVSASEATHVVETIVTIQRDHGDRANRRHARMKYLIQERGIDWFRTELERRLGCLVADPKPVRWSGVDDHLGWHEQGDGRWYLGLYVENGRIKDDDSCRMQSALRNLVDWLRMPLRLTGQQNILLTGIEAHSKPLVDALLASHGVTADPKRLGIRRDAMACPALPTCGLALADAERALPAVVAEIEDDARARGVDAERISIRMTGCPNGCARPYMGDIGFVGRSK